MSDEEFIGVQAPEPENTNDELSTPETEGWIKDSLAALQTPEPLTNQQVQDLYKVTNPSILQKILKVEQSKISDYNAVASKLPKGISKDTLEAKKEAASVNIDIIKDRLVHLDKNVIAERTKLAKQRIKDEDLPDYIKDEYQHYLQQLRELKKSRGKKELPKSLSEATDRKTTFFKNWSTRGVDNAIKQFVKAKQEEQQKQQEQDELNFKIAEARDEIGWRDDEDLKEEVRMRPKEERFEGLSFKKLKEERTKVGFEKFLDAGVNKQTSIKQTEIGGLTEQVLPEPMELPTVKASDKINKEKDKRKEDKRDIKATEDMLRKADDRLFKLLGAKDDKKEKHTSFWDKVGQVANEILKLVTIFSGLALWKWLSSDDPTVDTENKTEAPKETPKEQPKVPEIERPKSVYDPVVANQKPVTVEDLAKEAVFGDPSKTIYQNVLPKTGVEGIDKLAQPISDAQLIYLNTYVGVNPSPANESVKPVVPVKSKNTSKKVSSHKKQISNKKKQGNKEEFAWYNPESLLADIYNMGDPNDLMTMQALVSKDEKHNPDFYQKLKSLKSGDVLLYQSGNSFARVTKAGDDIYANDKDLQLAWGGYLNPVKYGILDSESDAQRVLSTITGSISDDGLIKESPQTRNELGSTDVEDITKVKTINAPRNILPTAMSSQIDNVSTTASSYVFNKENKVDVSKQLNQSTQAIRDAKFRRGNPDTKIEVPMRANGTGQAELQTM